MPEQTADLEQLALRVIRAAGWWIWWRGISSISCFIAAAAGVHFETDGPHTYAIGLRSSCCCSYPLHPFTTWLRHILTCRLFVGVDRLNSLYDDAFDRSLLHAQRRTIGEDLRRCKTKPSCWALDAVGCKAGKSGKKLSF